MAKRDRRQTPSPNQTGALVTPDAGLLTKSARDADRLMSSVTAIKPEWVEAGKAIASLYREQRRGIQSPGRLASISDPDYVAAILAGIDAGSTPAGAATAIGASHQACIDAVKQGEDDRAAGLETAHALFAAEAQRARERRRQRLLGRIEAAGMAGPQFWIAPAWLLERGYGNDYKLNAADKGHTVIVNVGIVGATDVRIGGESASGSESLSLPDVIIGG